MAWIPFTILGLALTGSVLALVVFYYLEANRTREFTSLAESLGLEFLGNTNSFLRGLESLPLFQQGRGRTASNVLRGGTEEEQLYVFDYCFTTGSGKHRKTHRQTVACFVSQQLTLPQFEIFPQRWYHWLGQKMLGQQDIRFDEYPEFCQRYVVRGSETGIRSRFREPLIRHLESERDICVAGQGYHFIFFRRGKRVKPYALKEFMESAYKMYAFAKNEA